MRSIIKELCWTNPCADHTVKHSAEYEALREQRSKHEHMFIDQLRKLKPELVKEYFALDTDFGEILATTEEDAFVKGFRLGLILMAEAMISI